MNGRNFLINVDGTPKKHGFHQNVIIEAEGPRQAKLLATAKMWHDHELKKLTLNSKEDPPQILLETLWEFDIVDDVGLVETKRTFYVEKKWWQFWK